jgi:hypothetical protein
VSTTPEADAFYAARDIRTAQYGGDAGALGKPVTLLVTAGAAESRSGQVASLAMVEMLTRVHRRLRIVTPDAPLLSQAGTSGTFREVLHATAAGIDPHQDTHRTAATDELVVQVGPDRAGRVPAVLAAWNGGRGEVHLRGAAPATPSAPAVERADTLNVLGATTAAVLAAAATFRLMHGDDPRPSALNLLERTADDHAGSTSLAGPVDVGDVVMIGAGAVAHAATYWIREFGHVGRWRVVDADQAEIHNTGRCLGMTAADAGWPGGRPVAKARLKVDTAAGMIGAEPDPRWFHQTGYRNEDRPDLILPLANEHGIRAEVGQLGQSLLLHATTSQNWTSELHRHVAGQDDCPGCRIPEQDGPALACSEGGARPQQPGSQDAALPFLSAAAGLLLTVALLDLAEAETFLAGPINHWRLHLELGARLWQRLPHPGHKCPHMLSEEVRRALQATSPRRWDHVEGQGQR